MTDANLARTLAATFTPDELDQIGQYLTRRAIDARATSRPDAAAALTRLGGAVTIAQGYHRGEVLDNVDIWGPEQRDEWTWRHNAYVSTANATTDRAAAERSVARCRTANPGDPVTLMHRTVTPWTEATEAGPAVPAGRCPDCWPTPGHCRNCRGSVDVACITCDGGGVCQTCNGTGKAGEPYCVPVAGQVDAYRVRNATGREALMHRSDSGWRVLYPATGEPEHRTTVPAHYDRTDAARWVVDLLDAHGEIARRWPDESIGHPDNIGTHPEALPDDDATTGEGPAGSDTAETRASEPAPFDYETARAHSECDPGCPHHVPEPWPPHRATTARADLVEPGER